MADLKIDRINELYRKSKEVGLTEEEKAEQAMLRKNYIEAFHNNMRGTLNNLTIEYPDGTREKVSDRKKNK